MWPIRRTFFRSTPIPPPFPLILLFLYVKKSQIPDEEKKMVNTGNQSSLFITLHSSCDTMEGVPCPPGLSHPLQRSMVSPKGNDPSADYNNA